MNKKEQVVEWMQSLEIKQLLEYSKLDVQMIGDMVDSMRDIAEAPEDEKMEKAERPKEPLAFSPLLGTVRAEQALEQDVRVALGGQRHALLGPRDGPQALCPQPGAAPLGQLE